jgi:ABC-2 type transport system permease protein
MEYRVAFFTQIIGMILNNAAYFIFWIIFFNRFEEVQGWHLSDMFILFGICASSFGLGVFLFGNITSLADIITKGQLDFYLSLPRPVLLHALASRSIPSGLGDFIYGIISFAVAGQFTLDAAARFILGTIMGMVVFLSYIVIVQTLAFRTGSAQLLSSQAFNAIITFALYPIRLFEGGARFMLYVMVPAAFLGSVPANFVSNASWSSLLQLTLAATLLLILALFSFSRGLQKYESGSIINIQV